MAGPIYGGAFSAGSGAGPGQFGINITAPSPVPIPIGGPAVPTVTPAKFAASPQVTNAQPADGKVAGGGASPSGPQPVDAPQEGGRFRTAIDSLRETTARPGVRNAIADFSTAAAMGPVEGGPVSTFMQGFARATLAGRARESAEAAAGIAAEERAAAADDRRYDRNRDSIEDDQWNRDATRADSLATSAIYRNTALNAGTMADIAALDAEAAGALDPDDIVKIEDQTDKHFRSRIFANQNPYTGALPEGMLETIIEETLEFRRILQGDMIAAAEGTYQADAPAAANRVSLEDYAPPEGVTGDGLSGTTPFTGYGSLAEVDAAPPNSYVLWRGKVYLMGSDPNAFTIP